MATAAPQKQAEILLESGTNELEVLVFYLGRQPYGVNVAKVREVILHQHVAASPGQPGCVQGMFNLRGNVLPLVDLHRYFGIEPVITDAKNHRIIVTEFNGARAAFRVERVEHIYRMSWTDMRPVPETGTGAPGSDDEHFAITGITEINGQLVLMLDFESVFDHICLQDKLHIERVENPRGIDRGSYRVWIAEDSKFIRGIMHRVLTNSGYTQVEAFDNGLALWADLEQCAAAGADGPHLVITDIEMPQMDGLHLTRRIKGDSRFASTPVLLFSSLITDDTRHKGQAVGADEQIAKPDLPHLVEYVDKWVEPAPQTLAA